MTHQLITLDPLARVTSPVGEFPPRRSKGDPAEWTAPPGHAYVPILPPPDYDSATHRIERHLTDEADGWQVIELTPEEIEARKPQPEGVTKLTIMRRLGPKWPTLKAILASLPEDVQDAWTLAQEIRSDDPMFLANAGFLKTALDLTDAEFTALLTP